jgi:hypothetical protein
VYVTSRRPIKAAPQSLPSSRGVASPREMRNRSRPGSSSAKVPLEVLPTAITSYRFVRRYLEARPHPALSLRQVDPLIRDLTHYRDVIARMTKET